MYTCILLGHTHVCIAQTWPTGRHCTVCLCWLWQWAQQKWMNRSRCHLGNRLKQPLFNGAHIPHGKGDFWGICGKDVPNYKGLCGGNVACCNHYCSNLLLIQSCNVHLTHTYTRTTVHEQQHHRVSEEFAVHNETLYEVWIEMMKDNHKHRNSWRLRKRRYRNEITVFHLLVVSW